MERVQAIGHPDAEARLDVAREFRLESFDLRPKDVPSFRQHPRNRRVDFSLDIQIGRAHIEKGDAHAPARCASRNCW